MGFALGRNAEEEYHDNLHQISERLRGQCGLLMTNSSKDEVMQLVLKYFRTCYTILKREKSI